MAVSKTLKLDKSGGVDIKPDSYIGLLLSVIHVGTQKNTYKGVTSFVDQLALRFELQDLLSDKGNPVIVTKIMRNSMKSKASLVAFGTAIGADLEQGMDFDNLVGKPVLVEMGFNEAKTKVGVKGFTALPSILRKEVKPLMGTPTVLLDVDSITESQSKELPEWLQKVISSRVSDSSSSNDSSSHGSVEL